MMRAFLTFLSIAWFSIAAHATHNRAGEITYAQIGELTIRATITTYTKTSSVPADRDTLELFWGDGTSTKIGRSNGNGDPRPNDIKINYYIAEHTYPGRATYTLSMMDPNRIGGISNVNPPNSEGVPFYIETTFTFLNSQFQGYNSSPVLLQPPLDFACVHKRFIHNPDADDPDRDSLSYELIIPLQDSGMVVPNYIFPDQILPGPLNHVSLDPVTGDFVWDAPAAAGTYNIAIRIHEYRNGIRINSMIRDMQIIVLICEDDPPIIASRTEFCVVAGDTLEFDLSVSDPNVGDLVQFSMLGGPLQISDQISLSVGSGFMSVPFQATFRWITTCDEISAQYYTIVFRAVDNAIGGNDTTGLADLQTVRIKVVGPPPDSVDAQSINQSILVRWAMPYACEVTSDGYFRGFSVWRREGAKFLERDTCMPGLAGRGYLKLAQDVRDIADNRYYFEDMDVDRGRTYCYRVVAEFARQTISGQPYNRVAGLHSDEECVQLNRDVPLITEVTVDETDMDGAITVRWLKPLAEALDTVLNPGPYRTELLHSAGIGGSNFSPLAGTATVFGTFAEIWDTVVTHVPVNTMNSGHNYRVNFSAGNNFSDHSPEASSVFLNADPTDKAVLLQWEFITPWNNYAYEVYRKDPAGGGYTLITTTPDATFKDKGLTNGEEYCYYIRTIGTYGISGIQDPLFNLSQTVCVIPVDNVAPCAPFVEVRNICAEAGNSTPEDAFRNTLVWNDDPACEDDIAVYRVYFASNKNADFTLIGEIDAGAQHAFIHQPDLGIAGCYAVTAIDEAGNESPIGTVVCVENCPLYELPNAFTPNGDGSNDLFIPFPYRFVDRVDMKIFNRWGQLVYQTTDPDILWNGRNLNDKELADGVYHYICQVYEQPTTTGAQNVRQLSGFIELLRGSN